MDVDLHSKELVTVVVSMDYCQLSRYCNILTEVESMMKQW